MFTNKVKEFAIDLGTKNIVIMHNDKILIDDEAVMAVWYDHGSPTGLIDCGKRVLHTIYEGTPDHYVRIVRPFKNGKVEDEYLFRLMLDEYIKRAKYLARPKWQRCLIDIPKAFDDAPALWVYSGIFIALIV